MVDKIAETVLDITTLGLNNPESYVLTHHRFNTYLVLIFSDLETQNYEMPYRESLHHEIEIVLSFSCLNAFKPNKDTEDYYIREPKDEKFLFEVGDKKRIYLG